MFDELMPGVDHRFCVRHLYNNFSKDYKGKLLKDHMWATAKATNMSEFQFEMGKIKNLNIKAWEWLVGKKPRFWTRAAFKRYPRFWTRQGGRPKKKRKKELGELENPYKTKRRIGHVKCSQCGTVGHNKRRCNPTTQASKQLRVRLVIFRFFFPLFFPC